MTRDRKVIVIDALSALQGGGRTYLINLFRFFPAELASTYSVIALLPRGSSSTFQVSQNIQCIFPDFASRGIVFRMVWAKLFLPRLLRSLKADILFCPGGFVSAYGSWKTVVTFQNMLPFSPDERRRYPLGYVRARLAILRWIQARSFRRADLVIFISDFAKSVIDIIVSVRNGASVVIPHGVSDQFRGPPPQPSQINLPTRYVCYVSILNIYKAQMEVVKAWSILRKKRDTDEKLVLVGPAFDHYAQQVKALILELGLQDEIIILGDIPYSDLPGIYQGAVANLFASSCENCPFILLEALAAGRPLVCSDYQPMPEFARDAALYFDPYAPESLVTKLLELLDDQDLQEVMGRKALERSLVFEWETSALRTWAALAELSGINFHNIGHRDN